MSEANFATWAVDQSPILIEYSLAALDQIRAAAVEGFQRLSRGGIEVGGILFGTRQGRTIRIAAVRPIACEHARGPAFLLSDNDRAALIEQLANAATDPGLHGMISLGWFVSHTRSEIALSEHDLEVYNGHFSAPWEVTLVMRPGRHGEMRAGFFVRESDGAVRAEHSYLDFTVPERGVPVIQRMASRRLFHEPSPSGPESGEPPELPAAPASAPPLRAPRPQAAPPQRVPLESYAPPRRGRSKWPWFVAAALAVAAVVFALRFYTAPAVAEPIGLQVLEREGQLQIEWNHSAQPVVNALRGSVLITDGDETHSVPLSKVALVEGRLTYTRKSGDVGIRLTLAEPDGAQRQETARFLGRPPAVVDTSELTALRAERDQLSAENTRLRGEAERQAARTQQLERTIRILENRLQIDRPK